ncbi:OLC1v1017481C1 [Oldenlandia corymbosa var. corymbosa]|uniref:OLC1v1017481C1 n=1 Tax=Oldenlandia corymbosa var. corymbosa TaxID=529605 RepID=A0AAV1E9H3_OLDCO|nr:OLC1v1017481C1 [Oldenlandia corymbosa var. corymbosa]
MGAEEELNHIRPEQDAVARDTTNRSSLNRITPAQFLSWKRQKDADASAKRVETERKRAEDIAAGLVPMNGRELFQNEPWVFDNTRY